MLRLIAAAALSLTFVTPLAAQTAPIEPLYDALGMPDLLAIMREEGIGYGAELESDLFPGRGRATWAALVESIYDIDRMGNAIRNGLDAELSNDEIGRISAFFASPQGKQIVEFEIAARRAMLDKAVEVAAHENWITLEAEGGPRWLLLSRFAEVNDLVESNVAGAMTANYAFYMGLVDGKAFDFEMTESEILSDVWSQEPAIREDTVDWVFSFTALAYQPLSDDELDAYIDFTGSEDGQALNAALFNAFNTMFTEISRKLGEGAARVLSSQDI